LAVWHGIDPQVPEASASCQPDSVANEGAKYAAVTPGGHGAASPEAGEVRVVVEFVASGRDRCAPRPGDHGRGSAGSLIDCGNKAVPWPGMLVAEHLFVHTEEGVDALEVVVVRRRVLGASGRAKLDAVRRRDLERQFVDRGDHQSLVRLALEAGSQQPLREVSRRVI
jgi:hypothetical protein